MKSNKDIGAVKDIISSYKQNEIVIVNQLFFKTQHGPTIGGFREEIWKSMFEQIIPKKFVIEQSVFIIDSNGRVSKEVDLAIIDEMYTPYIFRNGRIKFIPIEAVAVVIECKSTSQTSEKLKQWVESIEVMKTNLESYTRFATNIACPKKSFESANNQENKHLNAKQEKPKTPKLTQSRTRPLRIFCCLNKRDIKSTLDNDKNLFDIVIKACKKKKKGTLQVKFDTSYDTLQKWYLELNHYKLDEKNIDIIDQGEILQNSHISDYQVDDITLLSLNLQLNQLLMLINNPIPFPHFAYAKMFNGIKKGVSQNE